MSYRQELKYLISGADRELLISRLSAVMTRDPYSTPDGTYGVRTLYFDDIYDSAMSDSLSGAPEREKFRLRMYNNDDSFLRLEKKIRLYGGGLKPSARLTREQCERLINGDPGFLEDADDPFLQTCLAEWKSGGLRPQSVVQYTRTAFMGTGCDLRVTVDSDIRVSRFPEAFFNKNLTGTPVFENSECVLEVKYDHFLPDYIPHLLGIGSRPRTAMSKFAAGRIYY